MWQTAIVTTKKVSGFDSWESSLYLVNLLLWDANHRPHFLSHPSNITEAALFKRKEKNSCEDLCG